jgi:hypothetical protein
MHIPTQNLTLGKKQKRIKKQKARKQLRRSNLTLIKREKSEKTTLVYPSQSWETNAFARAELYSEELT